MEQEAFTGAGVRAECQVKALYCAHLMLLIRRLPARHESKPSWPPAALELEPGVIAAAQRINNKVPPLKFASEFECGNLQEAWLVGPNEYVLYLCNDTNTGGHRQWFYFAVSQAVKKVKYRFHVVNMSSHQPLLCAGMRPLLYSESRAADGIGWRRAAMCTHFSQTDLPPKPGLEEIEGGFTLTFTMELAGHGSNYIAFQVPYSLRDLRIDLSKYVGDEQTGKFAHWSSLCTTLNGHSVDMLTISNEAPVVCAQCGRDWDREAMIFKEAEKQLVVFIARMRPGDLNNAKQIFA